MNRQEVNADGVAYCDNFGMHKPECQCGGPLEGASEMIEDAAFLQWCEVVTQEIHAIAPRAFVNCDLSWLPNAQPDKEEQAK